MTNMYIIQVEEEVLLMTREALRLKDAILQEVSSNGGHIQQENYNTLSTLEMNIFTLRAELQSLCEVIGRERRKLVPNAESFGQLHKGEK